MSVVHYRRQQHASVRVTRSTDRKRSHGSLDALSVSSAFPHAQAALQRSHGKQDSCALVAQLGMRYRRVAAGMRDAAARWRRGRAGRRETSTADSETGRERDGPWEG